MFFILSEFENEKTTTYIYIYIYLDSQKQLSKVRGEDNPNVRALSNTLRDTLSEKGNASRAMVFVQSRETCISLTKFLGTELEDRVHHYYGKGKRGYIEGLFTSII